MTLPHSLEAICFDAFGTLVEITDNKSPYKKLMKDCHKMSHADFVRFVMCHDLSFDEVLDFVYPEHAEDKRKQLFTLLEIELSSIKLRSGVFDIWTVLKASHLKVAVCSNLAMPYGEPFLKSLPTSADAVIFSYQVGSIKPDKDIYRYVCDGLGIDKQNILFVGDRLKTDIEGPRNFGMRAMHISDFEKTWLTFSTGLIL